MSSESTKKPKKRAKPKSTESRSPSTRRKEGTHPTTTKPEVGKRVRVYRNGDPYHKGINVVLNMKHSHDINAFLDAISERVGLISGVKRLYTRNGTLVRSTQQLENNHEYVASSGGFMPLDYGAAYHKQQNAFVHRNRAGNDKREDSVLSLSSKRSAPSRLTRSNTELRSTSRGLCQDLTVTSLNGSSTKSSTTGSTINGTSGRSRSFAVPRKNRAESKAPEKKKTTSRANSTDQTKSKLKKKKVKKSDDEKKTNGKTESTKPKRKVKKAAKSRMFVKSLDSTRKSSAERKHKSESPETPRAANRTPPSVVVHESESRPSTRAESRFSGHRPASRRSQRSASSPHGNKQPLDHRPNRLDRQTPTADEHRSDESHREETRHSETEHSDNEHRHSENEDRHSENENRKSDSEHEQNHRNETPPTHRTDHSEHEDRHSTSSRHQERRQSEHHTDNETHSGVSDETDEENEHENGSRRQSHDANSKPKTDVPLEAL
ncbi:Doublecortin [Aphelenchoides besseyi]|nr:Doublecortin [Aphelenchoides besseyi]